MALSVPIVGAAADLGAYEFGAVAGGSTGIGGSSNEAGARAMGGSPGQGEDGTSGNPGMAGSTTSSRGADPGSDSSRSPFQGAFAWSLLSGLAWMGRRRRSRAR